MSLHPCVQVDALNKEKALVPPVVLALPRHLRGVGAEQLEELSSKVSAALRLLDEEKRGEFCGQEHRRTGGGI